MPDHTQTYHVADSPVTFLFAGKQNIAFSGIGGEGNQVGADLGGGACVFAGAISNLASLVAGGATGVTINIPAGGGGNTLDILVIGGPEDGTGFQVTNGADGDAGGGGGSIGSDLEAWATSSTDGTDSSITGTGADGELTVTWDNAATGSPAMYYAQMANQ